MSISRREFIRLGSLCAISAGVSMGIASRALGQERKSSAVLSGQGFAVPFEAQSDALFTMTQRTFTQYLETKFIIDPGYTFPIETKLTEVKDLRSALSRKRNLPGQECFVLSFLVVGDKIVGQGTYQIHHDALGTFELFVVPTKNRRGGLYFEAIINRVLE